MEAVGKNIILELKLKDSIGGIALPDQDNTKEEHKLIEYIKVLKKGKDVKSVNVGDEVITRGSALGMHNQLKTYKNSKEGTSYIGVTEDDIIGIY